MQVDRVCLYRNSLLKYSFPKKGACERDELHDALQKLCSVNDEITVKHHTITYQNFQSNTLVEMHISNTIPSSVEVRILQNNQILFRVIGNIRNNIMYVAFVQNNAIKYYQHIEYVLYILSFLPQPYRIDIFAEVPDKTIFKGTKIDLSNICLRF